MGAATRRLQETSPLPALFGNTHILRFQIYDYDAETAESAHHGSGGNRGDGNGDSSSALASRDNLVDCCDDDDGEAMFAGEEGEGEEVSECCSCCGCACFMHPGRWGGGGGGGGGGQGKAGTGAGGRRAHQRRRESQGNPMATFSQGGNGAGATGKEGKFT